MSKIGVISNPLSQRNKRGAGAVDELLAGRPDILHRRLDNFENLKTIVAELLHAQVEVIVVDGGDGTVQATLTELFQPGAPEKLPALAILSSGMTNMIAADAGVTGSPMRGLKRIIAHVDQGDLSKFIVPRHVIRMEYGGREGPVYGMFFGAAGIYRSIQICRDKVHSLGFESSVAVGLTIAGLLVRWLLPGRDTSDAYRGDQISVDLDGEKKLDHSYFLLFVTTLDRLVLRTRPYWGWQRGALRFTGVVFPPARFGRSILSLLYGGVERNLPKQSYLSESGDTIRLEMTSPFTLDGEFYQPIKDHPVELSGAGLVRFVKL